MVNMSQSQEESKKESMMNKMINSRNKCQVSQMSNVKFIDIVHKSKEFGTDSNHSIHNSVGEDSIPSDEIENTTVMDNVRNNTEDNMNGHHTNSSFDENSEETGALDESMFDSIVIDGKVANIAKIVSEMNGHFSKKFTWLSDQVKFIEEQNKHFNDESFDSEKKIPSTHQKLLMVENDITNLEARTNIFSTEESEMEKNVSEEKKPKKRKSFEMNVSSHEVFESKKSTWLSDMITSSYYDYIDYVLGESSTIDRNEDITRAIEMESTKSIQNGISREPLFSTTDILANNLTPIDQTYQDNNIRDVSRLSADISMTGMETKSGTAEAQNELEKYNFGETSNEMKRNRSLQTRNSRKRLRGNKNKKHIRRDVNINNFQKSVNQFKCLIVVNICVTLLVAILFPCIISAMIDRKLNKHIQIIQLVQDDIMNRTFAGKELLKLHLGKEIIDAKLKYLMVFLKENDEVLKNDNNNKPSVTKGVKEAFEQSIFGWYSQRIEDSTPSSTSKSSDSDQIEEIPVKINDETIC